MILTAFTVTRPDQLCAGHRDAIPPGTVAYADEQGWVWCADAARVITA